MVGIKDLVIGMIYINFCFRLFYRLVGIRVKGVNL